MRTRLQARADPVACIPAEAALAFETGAGTRQAVGPDFAAGEREPDLLVADDFLLLDARCVYAGVSDARLLLRRFSR
jgi:hypothetical protein